MCQKIDKLLIIGVMCFLLVESMNACPCVQIFLDLDWKRCKDLQGEHKVVNSKCDCFCREWYHNCIDGHFLKITGEALTPVLCEQAFSHSQEVIPAVKGHSLFYLLVFF